MFQRRVVNTLGTIIIHLDNNRKDTRKEDTQRKLTPENLWCLCTDNYSAAAIHQVPKWQMFVVGIYEEEINCLKGAAEVKSREKKKPTKAEV